MIVSVMFLAPTEQKAEKVRYCAIAQRHITAQSHLLNVLVLLFIYKPRGTKQLLAFLQAINEGKCLALISRFVLHRSERQTEIFGGFLKCDVCRYISAPRRTGTKFLVIHFKGNDGAGGPKKINEHISGGVEGDWLPRPPADFTVGVWNQKNNFKWKRT